jgi:hypothetical protein
MFCSAALLPRVRGTQYCRAGASLRGERRAHHLPSTRRHRPPAAPQNSRLGSVRQVHVCATPCQCAVHVLWRRPLYCSRYVIHFLRLKCSIKSPFCRILLSLSQFSLGFTTDVTPTHTHTPTHTGRAPRRFRLQCRRPCMQRAPTVLPSCSPATSTTWTPLPSTCCIARPRTTKRCARRARWSTPTQYLLSCQRHSTTAATVAKREGAALSYD